MLVSGKPRLSRIQFRTAGGSSATSVRLHVRLQRQLQSRLERSASGGGSSSTGAEVRIRSPGSCCGLSILELGRCPPECSSFDFCEGFFPFCLSRGSGKKYASSFLCKLSWYLVNHFASPDFSFEPTSFFESLFDFIRSRLSFFVMVRLAVRAAGESTNCITAIGIV